MAELKDQVEKSALQLKGAWTHVQSAHGTRLPAGCYEYWKKKAIHHHVLASTTGLFIARDKAWEAVLNVSSDKSFKERGLNIVIHGTIEMDFSVARHLALISYFAVTWSIYDRLPMYAGDWRGYLH
ncbi:MAG: hypothetical protein HQK55_03525 [Deltaproteobacteria bacterium]|nr:hypothetical protein [Deltaproteobacteria bacterium]